ncbi:hypothetical protein AGMMS50239_26830 [Bacteroidia bacterium]|nr:hypothetical protein AGMMS50239_26830 [Bacteroidia bacterium]
MELFLTIQFHDFADIRYVNDKSAVLNIYESYLKLIDYSGYIYFSNALLADYSDLYRKGRVASSLIVGLYLNRLVKKYKIKKYKDIVEDNIRNGIKNIYTDALSLKERIDLIKLIYDNEKSEIIDYEHVPDLEITKKEATMQNLLKLIDKNFSPIGYEAGLGRLLLFHANKHTEIL